MMLEFVWIMTFFAISGINSEALQNDGDIKNISEYSYMASIRKDGIHVCSGVILDESHIVTSDRCVPPSEHVWNLMNDVTAVIGTHSLKPGGRRILAKEMFSQNHFFDPDRKPITSGIGVIKLLTSLQFGKNVQPIESYTTEIPSGAQLQMIGWRITDRQGKKTSNLKKVTLEVVDRQKCQQFHKKILTESEFCTQPMPEGEFCEGDSGSPIIYGGKLVGFATYGISCKDVPIPDVHTKMAKTSEYINKIKTI